MFHCLATCTVDQPESHFHRILYTRESSVNIYLYKNECSTDHCSLNTFTLPIAFPVRVPMRVDHRYRCSTCNATTLLTSAHLAGPISESSFHCRWLWMFFAVTGSLLPSCNHFIVVILYYVICYSNVTQCKKYQYYDQVIGSKVLRSVHELKFFPLLLCLYSLLHYN